MTGPEHRRQAEELLAHANTPDHSPEFSAWLQRQAQVHATLALVMATVNRYDPGWGIPDPVSESD